MAILVTGGAGYIGSVTVELLRQAGEEVVVLDNLSRGYRPAVAEGVPFYRGNVGDRELVERIVGQHAIKSCVHFAAFIAVGESVQNPAAYYANNVEQGIALLDTLVHNGVSSFVFSSTAATYGEPKHIPIDEAHPQWPENPYGWTKFVMERVLSNFDDAYGLKFVALRYFNASGAIPGRGEAHQPETHLIPCIIQAAQGKRAKISVFGSDYPTPDGTAIRDYIHVADLGQAHILALRYLRDGGSSQYLNLGNGQGYSILEVIETTRQVTGRPIPVEMCPRRAGDPSRLIADSAKARQVLGWNPRYPALADIVKSAWDWHESHPNGYQA